VRTDATDAGESGGLAGLLCCSSWREHQKRGDVADWRRTLRQQGSGERPVIGGRWLACRRSARDRQGRGALCNARHGASERRGGGGVFESGRGRDKRRETKRGGRHHTLVRNREGDTQGSRERELGFDDFFLSCLYMGVVISGLVPGRMSGHGS
jgi:hypothetical protein